MRSQAVEWSFEEKNQLLNLYKKYKREWRIISNELNKQFKNDRTNQQCRSQYLRLSKCWSQKQTELLIIKRIQGLEWCHIIPLFPRFSEKQLRDIYNSYVGSQVFLKIQNQMQQEQQEEFKIKTIQQQLTEEFIPSFKFKNYQIPRLPCLQRFLTNGKKIIVNKFNT